MSNSSMLIRLIRALLHHSPTAEYDKSLSVRDSLTASIDRSETGWSTNRARRKYQQISSLESKIHHLTHVSIYLSISIFIHLTIYQYIYILYVYIIYIWLYVYLIIYLLFIYSFYVRSNTTYFPGLFMSPTSINQRRSRQTTSRLVEPLLQQVQDVVQICQKLIAYHRWLVYHAAICRWFTGDPIVYVHYVCKYIHKISIGIDRIIYKYNIYNIIYIIIIYIYSIYILYNFIVLNVFHDLNQNPTIGCGFLYLPSWIRRKRGNFTGKAFFWP
jgi:hypothetical protein